MLSVIIIMMSTQNKRTDNSANQFRKYQSGEAYNFKAGNMSISTYYCWMDKKITIIGDSNSSDIML